VWQLNQMIMKTESASPVPSVDASDPITVALAGLLEEFDCQPVLFVGAGLSRRYIGAPDWEGALRNALQTLGTDAPDYSYFLQKFGDDKVQIGTTIGDLLFEWAWKEGKSSFDPELFKSPDRYIFLKSIISSHLSNLPALAADSYAQNFTDEINALKNIRPHAIITTNYDDMLEGIFSGYEPIVGKGVLRYDLNSFGEIFHIHGIVGNPSSLILTNPDYVNWHQQSRYFAAKLLTYFVEHPILIFGYGLGDPNVRTILKDIGRIVADEDGLIGNVAQVVWHNELKSGPSQSEFVIDDDEIGHQYRLRVFNVLSLADVYHVLAASHELRQVNPAMLRALSARLMKLTRKDIPSGTVEVDYTTLEKVLDDDASLPKMLGLTFADSENKTHPFTITQLAEELKLKSWNEVDKLIKRVERDRGVNLRASDNGYHERIKTGKKSAVRKWSHKALSLFQTMLASDKYELTS